MVLKKRLKQLARIGGWTMLGVCLPWSLWWYRNIPTPGKGGILLALVATFMPLVWEEVHEIGRAGLILTLLILFAVEYRAIDKERKDYSSEQKAARDQERESFKQLLDIEKNDVGDILAQQRHDVKDILTQEERHFDRMTANNTKAQQVDTKEFSEVLSREQRLFASEEELFESLNGQLIPGDDPTPGTRCGILAKDRYLVVVNGGGHVFTKFPHIILDYHNQKTVWLEKKQNGLLALFIDIKDPDGKIAVRIDKDGFFINPGTRWFARRPRQEWPRHSE
jgi:hypothetical protein